MGRATKPLLSLRGINHSIGVRQKNYLHEKKANLAIRIL